MTEEQRKAMKDKILAAIQEGRVYMHSRSYFFARAAFVVVGTVLAAMAVLYLASFIIFALRHSGVWFVPSLGLVGLQAFLLGLPWLLILLTLIFVILLQVLIKRFAFAYGRPLLYSAASIVVLAICGVWVIGRTPVHPGLWRLAADDHLPFAGKLYRSYALPPKVGPVTLGEVVEMVESGFRLRTPHAEILEIVTDDNTTRVWPREAEVSVGDYVVVVGRRDGNSIFAQEIRQVEQDIKEDFFFMRGHMLMPERAENPNR